MKVTFWGTRGSIAKPGPSTVRYGGNTSCVEIRSDAGTLIVVDCGTGAHALGAKVLEQSGGEPMEGHLLISHTHWDHIQGLPFFAPLFEPNHSWHIYAPRGLASSVIETLAGQMQYAYFPITLDQLAARVHYHDLVDGTFDIGDVSVTTHYLNHPALTLGYRLRADGATVVYAADHEPHNRDLAGGGDLRSSRHDLDHLRFLQDADLVVHDAQYLAAEYTAKAGWGHSTVEYVVDAAEQARVARLALYHHDPSRDDDAVDGLVELARARADAAGFDGEVFAAEEGMEIELTGAGADAEELPEASGEATRKPALEDLRRSVLLSVRSPDIGDVIRDAAQNEGLDIWEVSDPASVVKTAGGEQPGIVVLEDHDDVLAEARSIMDSSANNGADVAIFTVTRSGQRLIADGQSITEWLLWPCSAVYVRTKLHAALLRRSCRWQNAPLPTNEDSRLRALQELGVLDTRPESRFDRFTKRASEILDVPVALVSLIDADRQWFKSAHGLDVSEMHRDFAFCAHAILDDQVLQVPDALADPRFADNPVVAGDLRVRFYAGAPLALSDGNRAGTLCVLDYRPRVLSEAQLDELRRLAQLVAHELEARSPDGE